MRLFFAVLVPEDIRRDLARACGKLPASWRPVQESQMHLTLVFMGDVSVDGLERVVEVGDWAAASFDAFQVTLGSTDCFPTPSNPRVLFVHADSEKLIPLAARLQKGLEQWADPKPFRPHLTIARRKVEAASFQKMRFTHSWTVDRFDLIKSTLGGGRAEHSVVKTFSLRNP